MVGAAPAPDLVVNVPTVSESAPAAGARFTLSATVRNQGSGPADSTTLRYYQSTDATITTGDTEVGTDSVSGLDASQSGDESISLTAPSDPGTYYYGACVDSVSESDTQNNCSAAVTVTVRAAPNNPANQRFSWQASTIVVSWDQVAGAEYYNIYYDDFFDSSCRLVFGRPNLCEELAANVVGTSYTHADPDADANYYWITACNKTGCSDIDSGNPARLEGSAPAPDLVVDTPTVSESAPAAGARITLSATVRNLGNGRSDSTTLRYYQSSDSTITTGDAEVGTDSVSRLDALESGDESISLTAPSIAGAYYYGACMEAVSDESDTTNNCSSAVTVTVGAAPAPDLVVDTPTVSESAPAAGARFTLSATVRNEGSGRSDSTTLRYYQSSDSTITTGDAEVGTDSVSRLDALESGDESISLTAPSIAGAYYYGACMEAVSDESDTTNNCSSAVTVTVGAAPAPDLVVDTPTVSESAPAAGARFTLNATVRNQGNGSADSTTLRYYQSSDSTITTGDTEVGTDSVSSLDASESGDESISLTAPSIAGAYYYGACMEAMSDESDTTNNCSSAVTVTVGAAPAPDLVVDTPTVSESAPAAGARFTLSATVRNQGNGSADSTTLRYYQSTDSTITTGDTEVGTDSVSSLDASESGDESITLTAPSIAGAYYYGACVDAVSDESDTTNNCSSAVTVTVGSGNSYGVGDFLPGVPTSGLFIPTVTVGASVSSSGGSTTITFTNGGYIELQDGTRYTCQSTGGCGVHNGEVTQGTLVSQTTSVLTSDLIVDPPTVSENPPAGGARFTLSATVRNQGNGRSDSTTLRYYRSTDSTITTGDTEVGTDSVSRLDASESGDESVSLTTPSVPGTYYYGACVDSVSDESDATNNCSAAVRVTVGAEPAPDLIVDTPTVSESAPAAGSSFTLSATVRNQGNGPADSTTLRYYQSTDPTITDGDTEVGTDSVFRLDASESGDESVSLTAPSVPGTYYYGACVDSVSDESDTTNNCSAAVTVTVGAGPAPDLIVDTPTVSESAPAAGARFTLSATVRNQGSGRADSTTLRYYQSTDSTITTGDTEVGTDPVFRLDASESGDESTSLTAPSIAGAYYYYAYYYGACVDAVSDESDTTNNCSPAVRVEVNALPAPDLAVDAPAVNIGTPAAGARFTLSATVRNLGNGRSDSITLRYYQSTDPTISSGDTEVGTDSMSGLDASQSGDESISLTAPSDPGTYYYGACVDAVTDESDTTNNCSPAVTVTVGAAPAPDLIVGTPTVSDTNVRRRFVFTLSATVRNQGNGPSRSDAAIRIRYYRSTDSKITTSDEEVDWTWGDSGSIPAGGSITRSVMVGAPFAAGMHYYGACVSPNPAIGEANTENNCSGAVAITVPMEPDVVVDSPTVSESSPAAGQSFTLTVAVHNRGNASSAPTTIRYNRSTNPTLSSFQEVGTGSVGGLAVSESTTASISLTAPSSPGTYYYDACVDSVPGEVEAGLNNCSAAVTVTVTAAAGAPDLAVDTPTVNQSSLVIGYNFSLFASVRNRGSATSEATTLRYYRSTHSTITTGDTEVGTDSVGSLDSSSSSDQSIGLPAPSATGTYYYGACVDAVSSESDTTNNCSASVKVTVGAPDLVVETPTVSDSSPVVGASSL